MEVAVVVAISGIQGNRKKKSQRRAGHPRIYKLIKKIFRGLKWVDLMISIDRHYAFARQC